MAGPRLSVWGALLLIPLAAVTGCAPVPPPSVRAKAAEKPKPVPPADPTPAPSSSETDLPAPSPTPAPTPESTPPLPGKPSTTDVVDPGGESGTATLVQTAKAERERRAHAGEPVVVITDKSLPHLPKGQLTVASPAKKKRPATKPDNLGEAGDAHDEQYWRGRALDIRQRWKKAADEVKELEQTAAGWRRRFYAENDPYARDSQIKPEWDRVLDRLGKARTEVDAAKKELDDFLEEGRRGGALPGWLREGSEQEPVAEKKSKEPGTLESKEPSIYKQPPESPPGDHSEIP